MTSFFGVKTPVGESSFLAIIVEWLLEAFFPTNIVVQGIKCLLKHIYSSGSPINFT